MTERKTIVTPDLPYLDITKRGALNLKGETSRVENGTRVQPRNAILSKKKNRLFVKCEYCDAPFDNLKDWGQHFFYCEPPSRYGMSLMRLEVLDRDRYRCQRCRKIGNEHSLEVHHITPRAENGPNERWNLITLCCPCHAETQPEYAHLILARS